MIDQPIPLGHAAPHPCAMLPFHKPPWVRRYRHVLLATDFSATTDSYHRRVVHMAHMLGDTMSLMHLQADAQRQHDAAGCDRSSAAILLDGLAIRLELQPQRSWITEYALIDPTLSGAIIRHGVDLIITGAPASRPRLHHCRRIAELSPLLGCHVIMMDDEPEWD